MLGVAVQGLFVYWKNDFRKVINTHQKRQETAEGVAPVPVLEEAPEAEGHELQ